MKVENSYITERFPAQAITIEPNEQTNIHHEFSATPERMIQEITDGAKDTCSNRNCGLIALCGFEPREVEEEGILPLQTVVSDVMILKAQIFCRDAKCENPKTVDEVAKRITNLVKISDVASEKITDTTG